MLKCRKAPVTESQQEPMSGKPQAPGDPSASGPDEFAHIPSPSRRPRWLAVAVLVIAGFLIFRLRSDVSYALSGGTARALGPASALADVPFDRLPLNRYVELRGTPERESAVVLDTQGAWRFSQFFRLRGTDGRFFVRRAEDPLPVAAAESETFAGRLLRFSDLSFAASIKAHFSRRVEATHFFRAETLASALGRPVRPVVLEDVAAERVELGRQDTLAIDVLLPGRYRVDVPREYVPEQAAAEKAVGAAGARVVERRETPQWWIFEVEVNETNAEHRETTLSALGDATRGVRLRRARETVKAKIAELGAMEGGLRAGTRQIPFAEVAAVHTVAPVLIPDDAVLLMEGETPRSQTKSLVILAILSAFAAVNLLALRRSA